MSFMIGASVYAGSPYRYDFESFTSPTSLSTSTNPAIQTGTAQVEMFSSATDGASKILSPKITPTAINYLLFPAASDYSVTWKEYITSATQKKKGFILRASGLASTSGPAGAPIGAKQGYLFMNQAETNGSVTFRIFKMTVYQNTLNSTTGSNLPGSGSSIALGVTENEPMWYRATVRGTNLIFEYSTDGINWDKGASSTDATYSDGLTQSVNCPLADIGYYYDNIIYNDLSNSQNETGKKTKK